jgi:hypothetical protein
MTTEHTSENPDEDFTVSVTRYHLASEDLHEAARAFIAVAMKENLANALISADAIPEENWLKIMSIAIQALFGAIKCPHCAMVGGGMGLASFSFNTAVKNKIPIEALCERMANHMNDGYQAALGALMTEFEHDPAAFQ